MFRKDRALCGTLDAFEIFSHFSVDRVAKRDGTNMPFIIWPDGSPCLLGNLYMLSLRNRRGRGGRQGLSRRGSKGGTMGEYAFKLSQLLRLCYQHNINIPELTDSNFSHFIETLRKCQSSTNPLQLKKTENTLIATGKVWLDFLLFVGTFLGLEKFVSPEGSIRAVELSYTVTAGNGRKIKRTYFHHHSFGPEARFHRRTPISSEQISNLKQAINSYPSSKFVKIRRHCLLALLTHTGARRSEIGNILIQDILDAYDKEYPSLRLETLKQNDDAFRLVPVTKMLLHDIKGYIEIQRRQNINSVYKGGRDHGYLFTSETTGRKLSNETLSNEILLLRKHSGMKEQICAHMFRHAFITNLFCLFIQRHQIENEDELRKALLDSKTFLTEVTQWTGHLTSTSLENYINLAFKSLSNYSTTLSSVHLVRAMEIFDEKMNELVLCLENGMSVASYKIALANLIHLRDGDFEAARNRST